MNIKKSFISLIMTLSLMVAMSITAFAATQSQLDAAISKAIASGISTDTIASTLTGAGAVTDKAQAGDGSLTYTIGSTRYYLTEAQGSAAVTALNGSSDAADQAKEDSKTSVDDAIKEYNNGEISTLFDNSKADLGKAAGALSGFAGILSVITGVLATLAIIGTTVFTACDICYLSFPMLHEKMDNAGASGGITGGQAKDGGTKFRFVTDDAMVAYQETSKDGKSPWGAYMKRRIFTFIAIAIIIYILLTGNVTLIIDFVLRAVSGIIDQFQQLAGGVTS